MKLRLFLFNLLFLLPLLINYGQDQCRTDEYHQALLTSLQKVSADYNAYLLRKQEIETFINEYPNIPKTTGDPFIIPVVVHVIWKTSEQNIPLEQIESQIEVLNRDFRKANQDIGQVPDEFKGRIADCNIEFQLAKYDPDGAPTDGIIRTSTWVDEFEVPSSISESVPDPIKFSNLGGDNIWDSKKYLNIWVGNLQGGTRGYAAFPEDPANKNGIVIDYKYFGNIGNVDQNYNDGRTAIHEVGHWLGLHHLWGDGSENTACLLDDNIMDTPRQRGPHWGCPEYENTPACYEPHAMFMNYMDYPYDRCILMFTNDQRDLMHKIIVKTRNSSIINLSVEPLYVHFPSGGDSKTITISRVHPEISITWQIDPASIPEGFSVSHTSGTNESTITVTASGNTSTSFRGGHIKLSRVNSSEMTSIQVSQDGAPIPPSPATLNTKVSNWWPTITGNYGELGLYRKEKWDVYSSNGYYPWGVIFKVPSGEKITARFTYTPFKASGTSTYRKFYNIQNENGVQKSDTNYSPNLTYDKELRGFCDQIYDANISVSTQEYPNAAQNIDIGFKDPWLFDYDGELNAKQNRPDNPIAYYKLGSYPININRENPLNYGVFLNTDNSLKWNLPTYSAIASNMGNANVNGKTIKFTFYGWSGTNSIIKDPSVKETPISFTAANGVVTANYKGSLITNKIESYTGNQRQIVDSYGYLHLVYQSMDKIWYERSSDNGATWELMNGGKPLNTGRGKDPSIDYYPNNQQIIIVYQDEYPSGGATRIQAACFMGGALQFYSEVFPGSLTISGLTFDQTNFKPVVAYSTNDQVMVSWQWSGAMYREGTLSFFSYNSLIWNTDPNWVEDLVYNSINPTIVAAKTGTTTFHLAWEYPYSAIKYAKYTRATGTNPPLVMSAVETPSSGCGFPVVFEPAISLSSNTNVLLVWKATPYSASTTRPVIYRSKTTSWSSFTQLGSYAVSANVGCPSGSSGYGVAWKEGSSSSTLNKIWIYGGIRNLSINGNHTKMLEGETSARSKVMTFEGGSSPFFITLSQPFSTIHKENFSRLCYGKQIVLRSDSLELYVKLTDMLLGNSTVKFNTRDSINTNAFIESEEFTINGSVNLSFNYMYGTTDSIEANRIFNGNNTADFVIDLIKTDQNGLTKTLKTISFNQNSSLSDEQKSLEISFNASHNGTYKIRITPKTNLEAEYYYSDIYNDENILMKKNAESINFEFDQVPTVYALSQNYPNPFNPSTVISYDIPEASRVTLKVYDILGREVADLVNEFKEAGRYNVKFDASHLSTGIYIYQLRANDYVSVKKMSFVK